MQLHASRLAKISDLVGVQEAKQEKLRKENDFMVNGERKAQK